MDKMASSSLKSYNMPDSGMVPPVCSSDSTQINLPYPWCLSGWYYHPHLHLLRPGPPGIRRGAGIRVDVLVGGLSHILAWAPVLTPTACGRPGSPRPWLILLFSVRLEAAGLPQTRAQSRPLSAE